MLGALAVGFLSAALVFRCVVESNNQDPVRSCCTPDSKIPGPVPEDGFRKLGPPQPGEWRARFDEAPQSFEAYMKDCANRRCPHRSVFYLQPLGGAQDRYPGILPLMREYAEIFFGVPTKILPPIPLVEEAFNSSRQQYNASTLIETLRARVPPDAIVYVGIAEQDLYSRGLNFVFGEGRLSDRTGVYSLVRFETSDQTLFLRRALKLMSHESGHIFSVKHCVTWSCVMQGGNSLQEADRQPLHLCPIDLRKLEWNLGFDRLKRYQALRAFYLKYGMLHEADWTLERLR